MAKELHKDSITFEYSEKSPGNHSSNDAVTVKFLHFEGVSPQQYARFFKVQSRKDKDGKFLPIDPLTADKSLAEYLDNYKDFEKKAVAHFNQEISVLDNADVIDNADNP